MKQIYKYSLVIILLFPLSVSAQFEKDIDTWIDKYRINTESPVMINGEDNHTLELDINAHAVITKGIFQYWSININLSFYKLEKGYLDKITGSPGEKVFIKYPNEVFLKYDEGEPFSIINDIDFSSNFMTLSLPKDDDELTPKKIVKRFTELEKLQIRFYDSSRSYDIIIGNEDLKIFDTLIKELNQLETEYIKKRYDGL